MGIKRVVSFSALFLLVGANLSFADRVCIKKSTGELMEYQSSATAGTLLRNRELEGLNPSDYDEQEVTPAQYKALRETWIDTPAQEARKNRKVSRENARRARENSIKARLGLSDQEFSDLREALSD